MNRSDYYHLALVTSLFIITGCSDLPSDATVSASNTLTVSSESEVSIDQCEIVKNVTLHDNLTLETDRKTYSLRGVSPVPTTFHLPETWTNFDELCLKRDPRSTDETFVYAFTKEQQLINSELIRAGYALSDHDDLEHMYAEYFNRVERDAQSNYLGVWASERTNLNYAPPFPVITPASVTGKEGQLITMRMVIASTGESADYLYWNSERNYTSAQNIAIRMMRSQNEDMQLLISRFDTYIGKTVDVSAKLIREGEKYFLDVENRSQIVIHGE